MLMLSTLFQCCQPSFNVELFETGREWRCEEFTLTTRSTPWRRPYELRKICLGHAFTIFVQFLLQMHKNSFDRENEGQGHGAMAPIDGKYQNL